MYLNAPLKISVDAREIVLQEKRLAQDAKNLSSDPMSHVKK